MAHALAEEPLLGLGDAYAQACAHIPIPWEKAEEREAMRALFLQLGSGTAAMRAQAAAAVFKAACAPWRRTRGARRKQAAGW